MFMPSWLNNHIKVINQKQTNQHFNINLKSNQVTGACRGVVFGSGITPDLTDPVVTPDLYRPPEILTAQHYFEPTLPPEFKKKVFFYAYV